LTAKHDGGDDTAYGYGAFGALDSVTLPDGRHVQYVLDGQNRRVGKKVDGDLTAAFLYGKAVNPQARLNADGSVRDTYVYGADG
jgi:YD repeat-containing protein